MISGGQPLDWKFDPLEALRRWPVDRQALLLHSGRYHPTWARRSLLASPTGVYRFLEGSGKPGPPSGYSQWLGPAGSCPVDRFGHQPFADLRSLLDQSRGIWIGYLSYDLGRWVERFEDSPNINQTGRHWPVIELGYCPGYLVHDALTGCWSAHGSWSQARSGSDAGYPRLTEAAGGQEAVALSAPHPSMDRSDYEQRVRTAKQYISAGDIFQVNLAQRLTVQLPTGSDGRSNKPGSSRQLFDQLARVSPAWYGAYLELAADSIDASSNHLVVPGSTSYRAILSTSPELFLQVEDRSVVTRPVKGTCPASVHPDQLRHSEKDVAELNMIVDLMRNDLGRVCDYGSVRVTQPRVIESHPTVYHGVATIQGQLHRSKHVVDLLRATLPAGSITGAPKVRAMQIINELEPVRRGPYSGCIGFLSRDRVCLNVAIRTMLADSHKSRVDFSVGSGIVADSQPASEYQETLDKAAPMLSALRAMERLKAED